MGIETAAVRGVTVHYGARSTEGKYGRTGVDNGVVKTAEWVFDYDELPDGEAHNLNVSIPANARIVSAKFEVLTAFTSTSTTSDLTVGLANSAGTAIDADGLLDATDLTQTVIANLGSLTTGTGALVGDTIGAVAGELVVAPSVDDLLTGKARVLVEYIVAKTGK